MKTTLKTLTLLFLISKSAFGATLLINEIYPNPKGPDEGKEWIEIINLSDKNINLEKHQIHLNHKTKKELGNTILKNGELLAIDLTGLTNKSGTISLISPKDETLDTIIYTNSPNGKSFSRVKNKFIWTEPTKNQQNPIAEIHQGTLPQLIEKIFITKNKNPLLLKLISKEKLQVLTLNHTLIKVQIIKALPP